MKRLLLILIASFVGIVLYSQVPAPLLWLRSDSLGSNQNVWRNVSNQQTKTDNLGSANVSFADVANTQEKQQSSATDAAFVNFKGSLQADSMNYNPSLRVSGSSSIVINSISTEYENITVMVVYRTNDSVNEQNVWQIGDSTATERAGQSTQKIYDNYSGNQFRENNSTKSVVCTQTQKIKKAEDETYTLKLGNSNALPFDGEISEVLLFSGVRHANITKTWESYLAVKYGITLCGRSYYNSFGDSIWNFFDAEKYSGQIIGIGRDNYFGLNQKQSKTEDDKIIFGAEKRGNTNKSNQSQIDDLQFIMIGMDTIVEKSEIYLENGFTLTRYGNFRVQKTGKQEIPTFLEIDCSDFDIENDLFSNLHLLINRGGEENFYQKNLDFYSPEFIDTTNKIIKFKNIFWDTDHNGSDIFCLALLTPDSLMNCAIINNSNPDENVFAYFEDFYSNPDSQQKAASIQDTDNDGITPKFISQNFNAVVNLYPNPSNGNFTIDIQAAGKTDFTISIFSVDGKEIQQRKISGQSVYNEEFNLRSKGEYQIKIQSKNEEQTLKILIF